MREAAYLVRWPRSDGGEGDGPGRRSSLVALAARLYRPKDDQMNGGSEVSANAMLFLSSLLLLIDIAPRDFFPSHKKRVRAIEVLREKRNIIGGAPSKVNIALANSGMSLVHDPESYAILADFIRRRSSLARGIDWARAIGIGYAVLLTSGGSSKAGSVSSTLCNVDPQWSGNTINTGPRRPTWGS